MTHDIYRNDDLDTRREMLILIQKLSPAARLAFLQWAADASGRDALGNACHDKGIIQHKVKPETNGENIHEIYWDVSLLVVFGLSIETVMTELARRVRTSQTTRRP